MEQLLLILTAVVALAVAFLKYLDFTRDVPPEYLGEQSVVDVVRNPGELAIHKSTKLDYSSGLRVGLGIRYEIYKLRNGNLRDIWEIALRKLKTDPNASITVCGETISLAELNHQMHEIQKDLDGCDSIWILSQKFITSTRVLAVVLAAFVGQITVLVDGPNDGHVIFDGKSFHRDDETRPWEDVVSLGSLSTFENTYSPEKDRGIALQITGTLRANITSCTRFTQTNLVSAVASCVKHLPPNNQFLAKDRLAIVQNLGSTEAAGNSVVKMLAGFMCHSEDILCTMQDDISQFKATVILAPREKISQLQQASSLPFVWLRQLALSRLNFSFVANKSQPLRLLYAHLELTALSKSAIINWNKLRAQLRVQVVEEFGHFFVAGAFLVTDMLDYRNLNASSMSEYVARGAVAQSNEIKLVNYEGNESGTVQIRGYNIGKAVTHMEGRGDNEVAPDGEGWYNMPFSGRWGTDGCLYVCAS